MIVLVISTASAQPTRLKITSNVDPNYIIDEIKSSPYILYYTLGKFYFKIGKMDDSLNMFKKSTNLNQDFAPAHHNLGVVYYTKGELDSALSEFKIAVELDSSYSKAHYS